MTVLWVVLGVVGGLLVGGAAVFVWACTVLPRWPW